MNGVLALERFSLECRIKPKPKQTLRPITTDADNPMSQSELEANTCNRRQARENVREQVMIGFGFTFDWLRIGRAIFKPIAKRCKTKAITKLFSTLN